MEYKAIFGIDGGVSNRFGLKYPNYYVLDDKIIAKSNKVAMMKALDMAKYYANHFLSNPDTGYTTITLLSLIDKNEKCLNQSSLINLINEKVDFDKDGKIVVKCSVLENLSYIKP